MASYSYKRWGGEDGLAEEKRRRDELKFDRSLARTKVRQLLARTRSCWRIALVVLRISDAPGAVSRHPLYESLRGMNVREKGRT